MNAKLIIDGKELNVNISEEILNTILSRKKTGYERCEPGEMYYLCTDGMSEACDFEESGDIVDDCRYKRATYYSDPTVAENNARADKLMRQLRRFAVEHRKDQLYWARDYCNEKWSIEYDCKNKRLRSNKNWDVRKAFVVYFDSEETVDLAIKTFHDELTWYFMEYKDSL